MPVRLPSRRPTEPIAVSVVMPVHAHTAMFRRAVAALAAADPPFHEVIVVCDGPATGAAEAARAVGAAVIERFSPEGPAAARNTGASGATGDVLFFVDSDVAVRPDIVSRVREAMAAPDVDAVVGLYDDRTPSPNFLSQYKNLLQRYVHLTARPAGTSFWGACGVVRREAFHAVGGFDERFRTPSVEDIDLGYRLTNAGFRVQFLKDLEVTHLKRWTLVSLLASDVFRRAIPWTWLLMRESKIYPDLNLRYRHRAAGATAFLLVGALGASLVQPRALWVAAASVAVLAGIDRPMWRFFRASRGPRFASAAIAWHWVYYLYSTLTLLVAVLLYPFVGRRAVGARWSRPALDPIERHDTT